ncbi:DUF6243 family protein [Phytomonospora sp. NPDC050363]|uniref:DUF6243 family protein n=1 Tax=Phytomonospora sp. NPDC050363 TaxID=3155642 RepID=UPI0033DBC5FC
MARGRDDMLGQGGQRKKMSKKDLKGGLADKTGREDAADSKAAMLERIREQAAKRNAKTEDKTEEKQAADE